MQSLGDTSCWIDDFGPLPVHRPQSVEEVSDLVRRAAAEGQAIYPIGGRTLLDFGLPPTKPGIAIDLASLDQVIDYPARDMTITVQAGITISTLQALLAAENQRLPIDVPQPDQATLGGAIATNASGPRRYGYGTLRDYVIGITVVNDDGQEVKAGGRVVKNVAGYDLCKLYTGSLGTLGIITQVTLKVRPRPERSMLVEIMCPSERLASVLDTLHASRTRPVCLSLRDEPFDRWRVLVGFEDNAATVAWQVHQVRDEVDEMAPCQELDDPAPTWQALTDFPVASDIGIITKASLLPRAVADFCLQAKHVPDLRLLAHAGNGIVFGHFPRNWTLEQVFPMLKTLGEGQGHYVFLRCPSAWKAGLSVWGDCPRGDAGLMRAVKEKLDPRRLFNPGRFVDGI